MHVSVLSVFSAVAVGVVFLRLWSRKIQRVIPAWNDYLCIAGLVRVFSSYMKFSLTKQKGLHSGSHYFRYV